MKARLYIRAARGANGPKIDGSRRVSHEPLRETRDGREVALPTVGFAMEIEVPDALLRQAEQVAAKVELTPEAGEVIVRQLVEGEAE